jgi:presqualene diphosphate synthase
LVVTALTSASPEAVKAEIRTKVAAAGSSFYWAMRFLPRERRDAMFAVYAFCREVDDIADADTSPAIKLAGLAGWRKEVKAIYGGEPKTPLGQVLVEIAGRYNLRQTDFAAVIDGMEMDARKDIRAPSLAELDLYCDRVAGAVGRLSVRIFGVDSAAADRVAQHLGRALQLTNILRDLVEDGERGRLYLPKEYLVAHGIHSTEPMTVLGDPALPLACIDLADTAEAHFAEAEKAMRQCPRRPMRPAAVMRAVYHDLLRRLRDKGWKNIAAPVKVPGAVKLWLAMLHGIR